MSSKLCGSRFTIIITFSVKPGGESLLAAGTWCPGKNELATIRTHIQRNSSRLRQIINASLFVKNFGPAKPTPKGKGGRQNIFGRDDELKTAPKGVAKDHKWDFHYQIVESN